MADTVREMVTDPSLVHSPVGGAAGPYAGLYGPWGESGVGGERGSSRGGPFTEGLWDRGWGFPRVVAHGILAAQAQPREPKGGAGFWVVRPRRRPVFLINSEALKQRMRLERAGRAFM